MRSPLPVRNGVNATRLKLPLRGPWDTVHEYVLEKFGHIDGRGITERFQRGEVVDAAGQPVTIGTALGEVEFLWYYRSLPQETPLPVTEQVLFHDENLVVVDKPHFLPTTPAGRYIQESLLVRLRNSLGLPNLVPIHRLDRGTAGLVLFSTRPETRGDYQLLFERREVRKQYQCVSVLPRGISADEAASRFPLTVLSRIEKTKGVIVSEHAAYEVQHSGKRPHDRRGPRPGRPTELVPGANASSGIALESSGTSRHGQHVGLFRLTPHTGKTHQLRIHMAMLGLGIMHDRFYPELWDDAPDDFDSPLQLLAQQLEFTDPISGAFRQFVSTRKLVEAPATRGDADRG